MITENILKLKINSDINILGGLPDFNLVNHFLFNTKNDYELQQGHYTFTAIKTDKSVKRFEKAILSTFLNFKNERVEKLMRSVLKIESQSKDSLLLLFWNSSCNNDLLRHLNGRIYFSSLYSGRIMIKKDEVIACLKELAETNKELSDWGKSTLEVTASKYLTLLKKFNLLEGAINKTLNHPFLDDKMFVLFVYWLFFQRS